MKRFLWLTYPVIVIILIIFSLNFFVSGNLWAGLTNKKAKVEANRIQITKLTKKLTMLKNVNLSKVNDENNYLKTLVPTSKQVPMLLTEIYQSATAAGVLVESYKGSVLEVTATASGEKMSLDVTFIVGDVDKLHALLEQLEHRIPLIDITKVSFTLDKTVITVSGLWYPVLQFTPSLNYTITDPAPIIEDINSKLSKYMVTVTPSVDVVTIDKASENPFSSPEKD